MVIDVEIDLSPAGVIADRVLPDSGLSTFVPETCARYFDPYVPMDSGDLASTYSAHDYTLEYSMPYARRQYNGDGFNFSHDKHALATAHFGNGGASSGHGDYDGIVRSTGGGESHNNMPPYIVVNMWRRAL